MLTTRLAPDYPRLLKVAVMRLACCAVMTAALAAANTPETMAAGEGVDPNFVAAVRRLTPVLTSVVVQPDGKILIGGVFTSVGGVIYQNVARLNSDGSLDASFNPDVNQVVNTIALQPDGKILIGGFFTSVGGAARNHIARLNPDGSVDASFNPDVDNYVRAIAVLPDGRVVIGGGFSTVGGVARRLIARLNPDGSVDASFNPDVSGFFEDITVQPDGKVIIANGTISTGGGAAFRPFVRLNSDGSGDASFNVNLNNQVYETTVLPDGKLLIIGDFTSVNGVARNRMARLNPDGSVDGSFNLNANSDVATAALLPDGKILIGGRFTSVGGVMRNSIARLNPDGSVDTSFNTDAKNGVATVIMLPDGKILISDGRFGSIGGPVRAKLARLNSDGSADASFAPAEAQIGSVVAIALQPDGKVIIGGEFTSVGGVSRNRVARLNPDGSLDAAFNPDVDLEVEAVAVQPDGKVIIGGEFRSVNGMSRNRVARLNPDGSLDAAFNPDANNPVRAIVLQPDGKILIGGEFTSIGGLTCHRIARLNPNGSRDFSFNPGIDGSLDAIALQPDGKILIGGHFDSVDRIPRSRVARLNPNGSLDAAFDPKANGQVAAIALQPDGKVVITGGSLGGFTSVGGVARNRVARLNSDGSLDASFNPDANESVDAVAVQPDGKILIGGLFTSVGGAARNRIARLNPDGSVDTSFNPNASHWVRAIAVQPDGKAIIGGDFWTVGGLTRLSVARLLPTPTLSLTSSVSPSDAGQPIRFTAAVTPEPASPLIPTGTVTFSEGGTTLGVAPLDSSGRAFFDTSDLAAGVHTITASYSGDQNFAPNGATITQTVEPPTVRLVESDTTVGEGVGQLDITVRRSGAMADSVSVDFTSADETASSRSDYTPVSGTLTFAPGETLKTFTIFVTDDAHVEGVEALTLTLSNPTGGFVLVAPTAARLTIIDNDTSASTPNPIDAAEFFVRQHYRDFLARDPDAAGLQFWSDHIAECESRPADERPACREARRANVSAAFFLSIEFQQTGFFALRAQRVASGRRSAEASRTVFPQFLSESRQLGEGVAVGQGDWPRRLEANRRAYLGRLVAEPAFAARFPVAQSGAEYVEALYASAGVVPTAAERQAAVAAFGAGETEGRVAALGVVADSGSVRKAELNPAFVLMQYFGYLRRGPTEAPDVNDDGYHFWLWKLDQFRGDFRRAGMVNAFIVSTEYRQRFGRP